MARWPTTFLFMVRTVSSALTRASQATQPAPICKAPLSTTSRCGGITLHLQNLGPEPSELRIQNLYDNEIVTQVVEPGKAFDRFWSLEKLSGWYSLVLSVESDPAFQQQFAGHLETGQPSRTDPQIGAVMAT